MATAPPTCIRPPAPKQALSITEAPRLDKAGSGSRDEQVFEGARGVFMRENGVTLPSDTATKTAVYWSAGLRSRTRAGSVMPTLFFSFVAAASFFFEASRWAAIAQAAAQGGSGLAVPRFVSLKADPVNLRKGPGLQFPIAWVFQRAGIPLEVVREYGEWREVRDASGTTGWVLGSLLSGRRTALVQPWERTGDASQPTATEVALSPLHRRAGSNSSVVARLEAGSLVSVGRCDGLWCAVTLVGFQGFIEQRLLWGVYPSERF